MPFITIDRFKDQKLLLDACRKYESSSLTSLEIRELERDQAAKPRPKPPPTRTGSLWTPNINGEMAPGILDSLFDPRATSPISEDHPAFPLAPCRPSLHNELHNDHKKPLREELLDLYLRPGEANALHIRRTLDQYYYPSLADDRAESRDRDQVIFRYQAACLRDVKAGESSEIVGPKDPIHSSLIRGRATTFAFVQLTNCGCGLLTIVRNLLFDRFHH